MEEKQKKVSVKRIQLVDVVLERKGSQMFEGRRVRSSEDAAQLNFEKFKYRAPGAQTIKK